MSPIAKMFDYVVIGGGSGGIASARRAASYGANVAVIEGARWGGTCVNVGCVPKKIMYNAAAIAETLHDAKGYGFDISQNAPFNWTALKEKRDAYILRLNGIYTNNLTKDTVTQYNGHAKFIDNKTIEVNGERLSGKHILIATGSQAYFPDLPGAKEFGITSDGFFELTHLPKKVALVGAGYIAIELAGIFHFLGSDVTLFIRHDHFLRTFDDICSSAVMDEYTKTGMKVIPHSSLSSVSNSSTTSTKNLTVNYTNTKTNSTHTLGGFEEIVFAVGRSSNIDALGLDKTAVKLNKKRDIIVDEYQETGVEGLYALGDVCGKLPLTPVAIAAGRKLSDRLFGNKKGAKLDYHLVPSVVFSHPPIGSIGLTQTEAEEKYGRDALRIYQSKFTNMYFSMTEHKQTTHYKIICLLPDEKVIGLHLVGKGSDEILQGFGVAMKMGATKEDFDNCVAIHPVAAEELVTMKSSM